MPPVLDPAEAAHMTFEPTHSKWPQGPVRWVPGEVPGTMQAMAVGSIDGKERREIIAKLVQRLPGEETPAESVTRTPTATEKQDHQNNLDLVQSNGIENMPLANGQVSEPMANGKEKILPDSNGGDIIGMNNGSTNTPVNA